MIIVKLIGGLGNQMFQYSIGRSLAARHQTDIKLDLSGLQDGQTNRNYGLDKFHIIETFATHEEVKTLTTPDYSALSKAVHRWFHNKPKRAKSHIRIRDPHFQKKYLNLPDNVYLEGYWQSEKYFKNIAAELCNEFSLKAPLEGENARTAGEIESCNAVSVHVRRGDYVSNFKANKTHGLVGLDYYRHCIDLINRAVKDCHFFVFSDDPEWCQDNLDFLIPVTFVSHNSPEESHEDLRLMSLCRHNIIANSTFSWWGAWLNRNASKIVYAPRRWYMSERRRTDGLIPEGWLRV